VQRAECGIAYFSRHYRFRPGATAPGLPTTRILAGLNEFNAGIWGADNGKMQMAVAPLAMDHRFRTAKSPEVFTAVLRTVPTFAAWLDALEPISDVFAMGGLHNTLRAAWWWKALPWPRGSMPWGTRYARRIRRWGAG